MTVKHVMAMIREYGLMRSAERFFGGVFYKLAIPVYSRFLRLTTKIDPKKVLFESTPAFSDNSWELFKYLRDESGEQLHFVWLFTPKDHLQKVEDAKIVSRESFFSAKHTSFSALKEIATSKFVFFTHVSPVEEFQPREGQIVVNLWHGCGIKSVGNNGNDKVKTGPFDVALVPGKVFIKTKAQFWKCDERKIMSVGYPRFDSLLQDDEKTGQWVNELKKGRKLVVWMPTFRTTIKHDFPEDEIRYEYDLPLLKNSEQMEELDRFCIDHRVLLCIKRHRLQLTYAAETRKFTNIFFLSQDYFSNRQINLYAFLHYTDALVSDYSSVAIDYLLLDKPIAYSLDDFEEYNRTRGFVVDNPKAFMPGHHLYNYEDLLLFLKEVADDKDPYRQLRKDLMPLVHNPCGNYSERVWQSVKELQIRR